MSNYRCLVRPLVPLLRPATHQPPILPFLYPATPLHTSAPRPRFSVPEDEDVPFDFSGDRDDPNNNFFNPDSPDPWTFMTNPPPPSDHSGLDTRPPTRTRFRSNRNPEYDDDLGVSSPAITLREREIFERIFESILSPTPSTPAVTRTSPSLASLLEPNVHGDGSSVSFSPGLPPSLRQVAASAARKTAKKSRTAPDATPEEMKILNKMRSDFDMLRWCETELFQDPYPREGYSSLLVGAMRIFEERYQDRSTMMALFERVKRAGAEHYVLGCTTEVYNRMMRVCWDSYADGKRILELWEEMKINGVEGDGETLDVLRKVIGTMEVKIKTPIGQMVYQGEEQLWLGKLKTVAKKLDELIVVNARPDLKNIMAIGGIGRGQSKGGHGKPQGRGQRRDGRKLPTQRISTKA